LDDDSDQNNDEVLEIDSDNVLNLKLEWSILNYSVAELVYTIWLIPQENIEARDEYYQQLCSLLFNLDQIDELYEIVNYCLWEFVDTPIYLFYKGFYYYKKWNFQKAEMFFNEFLKDEPNDAETKSYLFFMKLQKITWWKKDFSWESQFQIMILMNEFSVFMKNKKNETYIWLFAYWLWFFHFWNYEESIKYFQKVLQYNSSDEEAQKYLYESYFCNWDYEEACKILFAWVFTHSLLPDHWSKIWDCLLKLWNHEFSEIAYNISKILSWEVRKLPNNKKLSKNLYSALLKKDYNTWLALFFEKYSGSKIQKEALT
jgi:hypothetical protein